ncbi:PREDICTED: tRNA pseudouridine synthase-like 1 isoform X1 [Cercocebus atys]|uniref:tRNA pseudouridine synthase-like 1 isoform X1 n=1 Tax=Cercocebus atys TaxID=9531 RepID=UPI0005F3F82D|nr:PREDICTED: tRNA pseudouridine synthase-like 1 isoform X1 [Cercocebus atys]
MGSVQAAGSVRARYLVYFQYVGTDFNGVAAVRGTQRAIGVQNYLEEAAERLNSVVPVRFTISSRTDAGVHALSNAAHLDVQRRSGRPPFPPEVLAEALNTHLRHPAIRVLRAFRVPSDFHARHAATSRTYLYRLVTGCHRPAELPVFERNLCWTLQADSLDVAAMQEAAQHLLGTHDFSAFQSAGSPVPSPVRTLRRVSVSPGQASPLVTPEEGRKLRFWSLEFESQSFLYRQVGSVLGPSLGAGAEGGQASVQSRPWITGTEDDRCAGGRGAGGFGTCPGEDDSGEPRPPGEAPGTCGPGPRLIPQVSAVWEPRCCLLHPAGATVWEPQMTPDTRQSQATPGPTLCCSSRAVSHLGPIALLPSLHSSLPAQVPPAWMLLCIVGGMGCSAGHSHVHREEGTK